MRTVLFISSLKLDLSLSDLNALCVFEKQSKSKSTYKLLQNDTERLKIRAGKDILDKYYDQRELVAVFRADNSKFRVKW